MLKRIHVCCVFILIVFSTPLAVYAQTTFGCVDESIISPFFQCGDASFTPVCGCDNVTYRNECEAIHRGGLNFVQRDGVCQEDYVFAAIYPNNVRDIMNLHIQFFQPSPMLVQIRDAYGKLMFSENSLSVTSRLYSMTVSDYPLGVYFVFVISGDFYDIQKFVKY